MEPAAAHSALPPIRPTPYLSGPWADRAPGQVNDYIVPSLPYKNCEGLFDGPDYVRLTFLYISCFIYKEFFPVPKLYICRH